jgi:hypothetical protein
VRKDEVNALVPVASPELPAAASYRRRLSSLLYLPLTGGVTWSGARASGRPTTGRVREGAAPRGWAASVSQAGPVAGYEFSFVFPFIFVIDFR